MYGQWYGRLIQVSATADDVQNPCTHTSCSAFSGAQSNSQPQSFYVKNFSVNDITYSPVYMIESSVNGYLANGFK